LDVIKLKGKPMEWQISTTEWQISTQELSKHFIKRLQIKVLKNNMLIEDGNLL
jgi:hypothetical protein